MAITNIHPIKSTLDLSIDYICDPEKTDDKILISSYNCAPEVAALEFNLTQQEASFRGKKNFISKGTEVLAHHLIQSFNPGEISPENAHEIGKQLAEEILKGQYEYVLTTHIDKGHVHNHIIFNAVNFVTHQKYRSNKHSYNVIRNASDRLCKENGLHVLEESENKGNNYKEYTEHNFRESIESLYTSFCSLKSPYSTVLFSFYISTYYSFSYFIGIISNRIATFYLYLHRYIKAYI